FAGNGCGKRQNRANWVASRGGGTAVAVPPGGAGAILHAPGVLALSRPDGNESMALGLAPLVVLLALPPQAPAPGNYLRPLRVGDQERSYYLHVPPKYNPDRPAPLVVVFHGAGMNGAIMMRFSGLNAKADAANFLAVYPNGTGVGDAFL